MDTIDTISSNIRKLQQELLINEKIKQILEDDIKKLKQYKKEYDSRPENKARKKQYNKEYYSRPEIKKKRKQYFKEYYLKKLQNKMDIKFILN